jgi:hypothetical protein
LLDANMYETFCFYLIHWCGEPIVATSLSWIITLLWKLPNYLGSFNTNYIIFRKVEFFQMKIANIFSFLKKLNLLEFVFFKMKISKWISYLTNMCWSWQRTMVILGTTEVQWTTLLLLLLCNLFTFYNWWFFEVENES